MTSTAKLGIIDPMAFRIVKRSVIDNILGPAQKNLFRTLGYNTPELAPEAVLNNRRTVNVYHAESDFRGSLTRPNHHMTFHIDMMAAADSQVDLLVLEKQFQEGSIQVDAYRDAISQLKEAEDRADESMDELFNIVYQLIMDKRNHNLGVDRFDPPVNLPIGDRVIDHYEKGTTTPKGNLMMLGAQVRLKCRADEKLIGAGAVGELNAGADFLMDFEVNDREANAEVLASTLTE
jgi:hypothetical protein